MNNKLSNISTQYRKFSKGQYIKHPQFNEFLDFFEDQDRLSRVMLQGVGIVCGFQPQLIYTNKVLKSIQLSQGVSITTDGDLLTLNDTGKPSSDLYVSALKTIDIQNKQYTHFKAYDNYKVNYPAFYDNGKQVELWELATESEAKSGFQPIVNLIDQDKFLSLYLEAYEKEIRPCRGVDCDNHGIELVQNLKVLVTTRTGIEQILTKDKVYPHPTLTGLAIDKKLQRVILEAEPTSVSILAGAYKDIVIKDSHNDAMFHNIDVISSILDIPLNDRHYFLTQLDELLEEGKGFQYAYDVMKDLTDTHAEIIKILPKSFTKCLPDLLSFPKHIMLGKVMSNTQLDYTRHRFYNSPVLDNEKTALKVKLLIERFNQQTQQFRSPLDAGKQDGIKIVPSQKSGALGNKAIPFYYGVTEGFLKAWNFHKTGNRASHTNLGFDTTLLSPDLHIKFPLDYNIDKKPFYRIEGHQGVDYREAVNRIESIRKEQQLAFDIMALSLEELSYNKDISKAYFTEYVEKHPGLEHKGGVQRGGTFAVVYQSEQNPVIVADFSLPYLCCGVKSIAISDDAIRIKQGGSIIYAIKDNDDNANNDDLQVVIDKKPVHGIVVLNADGTITYTHDDSFTDSDSFTYFLSDGPLRSRSATVSISIDKKLIYPYKWIGGDPYCEQTTFTCLANMKIIVQYNEKLGPCPGNHDCDIASFYLRGNTTTIGTVYLSNTKESNDRLNYPDGETSGGNRYNYFEITTEQAQAIAETASGGFISFSLVCALDGGCHDGVAWTTILLNDNDQPIYDKCPTNNFLTINPCTGEIKE